MSRQKAAYTYTIDDTPFGMGREAESLIQFGNPQLVTGDTKFDNISKSGRSKFTVSQGFFPNERNKIHSAKKKSRVGRPCVSVKMSQVNDLEILNMIAPPRDWIEGRKHWRQMVSSVPATRTDIFELEKKMDTLMKTKLAHMSGLCVIRRHIMDQVFDELIRHVTVNCAERGLLLIHVRDDLRQVMSHYERVYTSAIGHGIRKTLQSLKSQQELMKQIEKLKVEVEEEKKIHDQLLPYYHRFQQQHKKVTEEEDKEYNDELDKLVKRRNALRIIVEQSVGPKKSKNKSLTKDKPKLLEKLANLENFSDSKSLGMTQSTERKSITVSHHVESINVTNSTRGGDKKSIILGGEEKKPITQPTTTSPPPPLEHSEGQNNKVVENFETAIPAQ